MNMKEQDPNNDGIHYSGRVINFFGFWVCFIFTIIVFSIIYFIRFQMLIPPISEGQNYLSEFVQLLGYIISALVGSVTTLLAVFGGNKVKDVMKATSEQRAADQKVLESNRKSVTENKIDLMEASVPERED